MLPPAASCVEDYIDRSEETSLIDFIDNSTWLTDLRRRVQHYGFRYDYRARRIDDEAYLGPLPGWLDTLAHRLHAEGVFETKPNQVIVNEYLPGQGIAPHIDCEPCFGDIIASLSLGSACIMEFSHVQSRRTLERTLPPRSLLVLQDEARFDWKHGIPARKSDLIGGRRIARERRLSLTFRTTIIAR